MSNSEVEIDDIVFTILSFMTTAQTKKMSGKDKKIWVLNLIKFHLGAESYERYLPFIEITIDTLKLIARSDKSIFDGLDRGGSLKLRDLLSCNFC